MTPSGLAGASGAPRSDIAKYEAGQASPQPPRLAAIARALGVPAAALLEPPPGGPGLAYLRAAAGLTQAELAGRAGIGLKRYELAELGLRPLDDDDIIRLAAATGATARQVRDAGTVGVRLLGGARTIHAPLGKLDIPSGPQPGDCEFEPRTEHARPCRLWVRIAAFQAAGVGSSPTRVTARWTGVRFQPGLISPATRVRIPLARRRQVVRHGRKDGKARHPSFRCRLMAGRRTVNPLTLVRPQPPEPW